MELFTNLKARIKLIYIWSQILRDLKISPTADVKIQRRFTFSTRVKASTMSVVCGPMFSGKTKTLISKIDDARSLGKTVFVFKPLLDDRYAETHIVSHDKDEVEAFNIEKPKEILDYYLNADVVAIDEAQFFDASIVQVCEKVLRDGKSVIIAGLDMDYLAHPFGSMPQLLALADDVVKLNSVCTFCSGRARHSHRISKENDQVVLGEKDKYVPLCRSCYNEMTLK